MKVAVLGANGQLGSDLVHVCRKDGHEVGEFTHQDVCVEDVDSVRRCLGSFRPDLVLNAAAFHVVPGCEVAPAKAFETNAIGALNVARICADMGAIDVYYSTDYVFDGLKRSPYVEEDVPRPLNVYGESKRAGEHLTLGYGVKAVVIRVSGLYGQTPCRAKGGNFVTTMLRLSREKPEVRVVTDEVLTPTSTASIARHSLDVVRSGAFGLFHLTCEGECSWFDFAAAIFDTLGIRTPLKPALAEEFPSPVRRPLYSVLENGRYNALPSVVAMPHWRDELVGFLKSHHA
jgi:dTDP-4-dehydrorhamnose reductase